MFKTIAFFLLIPAFSFGAQSHTQRLRLGDRFFVQSVLLEIFGPQAAPITDKYIFEAAGSFAGPCDMYEQVRVGDLGEDLDGLGRKLADPSTRCPAGKSAFHAPMFGTPSVVRQGASLRTCHELVKNPKTMDYALKNLFQGKKVEAPSEKMVEAAFMMFNPEKPAPKGLAEAFLHTRGPAAEEPHWTKIFLGLCTDPSWQVL